ncbi:MAG: carbamoyl phosphate synthase small subunit [Veillonellaceae bacterium]|nr:carbamoyl phosphate synthase small subunit [Veillonellaceae bacterium]
MKAGYLYLADGRKFGGYLVGAAGTAGEVVFTTGMTGYEESVTDPANAGRILVCTYPIIGAYGVNRNASRSEHAQAAGLVVAELVRQPSNWESEGDLPSFLREQKVPCLCGADTRAITRAVREAGGNLRGIIAAAEDEERALAALREPAVRPAVSTPVAYRTGEGHRPVVVLDLGVTRDCLAALSAADCRLTVVPATTTAAQIRKLQPAAVYVSNGPDDPAERDDVVATLCELREEYPIFGAGLGFLLLARACGATAEKLPVGRRGNSYPVRDEEGAIAMTCQNQDYALVAESLPAELQVTHRFIHDGGVQGFRHATLPLAGVAYYPQLTPGHKEAPAELVGWLDAGEERA